MGLGGYLMWTAVARELCDKLPGEIKVLPFEGQAPAYMKIIKSEIFENNPNFFQGDMSENITVFPVQLNNPNTNYCKQDTPIKAVHRHDKHVITQICETYGIKNPKLKCDLFLTDQETSVGKEIKKKLGRFVVIEPNSKLNYTVNREYPFAKWQSIVDQLKDEIDFVQVGLENKCLNNVIDMRGKTTFREAAGIIANAELLVASEGGLTHCANAVGTKAVVIITGYQSPDMICYPENININIASHGPCGMKIQCMECHNDAKIHDESNIIKAIREAIKR